MVTKMEDKVEERNDAHRRTEYSVERDLYVKPLLKLKQQEDIIERGLTAAINNMKIDANLLQDIVHEHRELSSKRQSFVNALYKNMEDIATELESAKYMVNNSEEIKNLDVNTYKLKLIKLSQKMQDFKKSCSIQALADEQSALDIELREFQPQLKKYESVQKRAMLVCQNRTENRKEKQDCKEVQDFHDLVARTGHTENWSMEDHLYFLKMRKKCENIPALVAAIQKRCPDLSTEIIVNHEAWYKHYEDLREKQRSVVKEWRLRRDLEKTRSMEETDGDTGNCLEPADVKNEIDVGKEVSVPKNIKSTRIESTRSSSSTDSSKSEKKELIRKWRVERESKRSMDEEQLKVQLKLKREMEENQRRRRREKIQEALEEYRNRKSLENASRESSAHSKGKCKYDSTLIKAFRKQDEEYTRRRKDLIQRSHRLNKNEMEEVKKPELLKSRSFSTLLNSTKVWREKCKVENDVRHSNELQYVKDIPKICVRWRNDVSGDLKTSLMLA